MVLLCGLGVSEPDGENVKSSPDIWCPAVVPTYNRLKWKVDTPSQAYLWGNFSFMKAQKRDSLPSVSRWLERTQAEKTKEKPSAFLESQGTANISCAPL